MIHFASCCCTEATCYCGTRCVGCSSSCEPEPETKCITEAEWDDNIAGVPGTGTGLVVQISGIWYFFDGTTSECTSLVRDGQVDWESAYLADECPAGCERELEITWTGSVTYAIPCCVALPGTPDQYYFDASGTGSQSDKTSPTMTLDADCLDQNENTALEYMVGGDSCGESYLSNVEDENFRLNFRLDRDEVECVWVIRIQGGGTVPGNVPNEAAGTGWLLRWTAPLSLCPPTSGWTLDETGSTLPLELTDDCDYPFGHVTDFVIGEPTINYLTP